jgi:hypothetical protein
MSRPSHNTHLDPTQNALGGLGKSTILARQLQKVEKANSLADLKRAPYKITLRLKFPFLEQKVLEISCPLPDISLSQR